MNSRHANTIEARGGTIELTLYDEISDGFARQVVGELRGSRSATAISLRLNSPGGVVAETIPVYNALLEHPAKVTVYIDGLAASAASMIAMAGDRVVMAANALLMIHDPHAAAAGTGAEFRRLADALDKHAEALIGAYVAKSGQSREAVIDMMAAETWLDADEALAAGFVDEIAAGDAIAASLDLSRFNPPREKLMRVRAGRALAGALNDAIDAIDQNSDDNRSRADVIAAMASEAGIDEAAVNEILGAEINCPPLDRLRGFASVDGLPSVDQLRSAAESDGCAYNTDGQAVACPNTKPGSSSMTGNITPFTPEALKARNSEIREACMPFRSRADIRDIEAECLADPHITAQQAREKVLDKLAEGVEPANPANYAPDARVSITNSRSGEFRAAVTDAVLARYGVKVSNPHPAATDVRNMSTPDIAATLLEQNGRSTRGQSKAEIVSAAMTTSDLPDLLRDTANKAVMIGFQESETATHQVWTREGELADFKEAYRVALSEAPSLEKVGEHGEYKSSSVVDAAEPIRAETYGRIVQVTRQALINDDLGEIARLPQSMGRAASRTEGALVYDLLTGNPKMRDGVSLFDSQHANLASGAALSVDALGDARRMMRLQRGLRGEATLNLPPRFLIVPAALETAAEKLLAEVQPAKTGDAVPEWVRSLELVTDSRLDEDSETAWYLAAAPDTHDTVEVARLGGQGAEVLTEEGFEIDAIKMKVRLDVGAAVLDWRGLVKNPGA